MKNKMMEVIEEYLDVNKDMLRKEHEIIFANVFLQTHLKLHECQSVDDFLKFKLKVTSVEENTITTEYEHIILTKMYHLIEEPTFLKNIERFGEDQFLDYLQLEDYIKSNSKNLLIPMRNQYHNIFVEDITKIMVDQYHELKKELFAPFILSGMEDSTLKDLWKKERIRRLTMDKKEVGI